MRFTAAAAFMIAFIAPGAAVAQAPDGLVSSRCSSIGELEPAQAAAVIYYVAGYSDAVRDAQTQLAGGTTDDGISAGAAGEAADGNAAAGAENTLTLSAEAVVTACSQSPDSRIADIITSQGGSGVSPASAEGGAAGAEGESEAEPEQETEPAPQ